mgnify:CR=1 FL=1
MQKMEQGQQLTEAEIEALVVAAIAQSGAQGPQGMGAVMKLVQPQTSGRADGRIARLTRTESEFGKELDSLADVVTFGVAPALLAWIWGFHLLPSSIPPEIRVKITQHGAICCF